MLMLILGLHIHVWIQQQYESSIGDNSQIRSIVFRKRNEEVAFALHKWRAAWNATLLHYPSSKPALYQKSAIAFWYPPPCIWIPLSHSFLPTRPCLFTHAGIIGLGSSQNSSTK